MSGIITLIRKIDSRNNLSSWLSSIKNYINLNISFFFGFLFPKSFLYEKEFGKRNPKKRDMFKVLSFSCFVIMKLNYSLNQPI